MALGGYSLVCVLVLIDNVSGIGNRVHCPWHPLGRWLLRVRVDVGGVQVAGVNVRHIPMLTTRHAKRRAYFLAPLE